MRFDLLLKFFFYVETLLSHERNARGSDAFTLERDRFAFYSFMLVLFSLTQLRATCSRVSVYSGDLCVNLLTLSTRHYKSLAEPITIGSSCQYYITANNDVMHALYIMNQ